MGGTARGQRGQVMGSAVQLLGDLERREPHVAEPVQVGAQTFHPRIIAVDAAASQVLG